MLTKTRQKEILKLLENRGSVTLQELKDHLNTSESTIRRDLNTLDAQGSWSRFSVGQLRLTT